MPNVSSTTDHSAPNLTLNPQESVVLCPYRVSLASLLVDMNCGLLEGASFLFPLYCVFDH